MKLTDAEKGYLAGLFDGEGCVGYYRRYTKGISYHSASLHICSTDLRAIEWVATKVGYGNVTSTQNGTRKVAYSWQLCNKPQVEEVLKMIRPYLIIKADQADALFTLWKIEETLPKGYKSLTPETIALRQRMADEIKRLKRCVFEGVETRRAESFPKD